MFHLTQESFDHYDSSNLGGYQFVNQGFFCLPLILYTFPFIQYLMPFLLKFLL
jgi:hypothetical protein